jgi:hypothetical protein
LTGRDETVRPVVCRTVRKDNTILYDSNRYSVPLGTYNSQPEVRIETKEGVLYIQTVFGEPICEHRITSGRGLLIQSKSHTRDRTTGLDKLQNDLDTQLENRATGYLQRIRTEKARYARDQFRIVQSMIDQYGVPAVLEAVDFCEYSNLSSANILKDYLTHKAKELPKPEAIAVPLPVADAKYHVTTQKRPLEVYAKVGVR